MEYLDVATARAMPGLRLVLTAGVPGPWGEAAKGVFRVKGIPFAPVRQTAAKLDPELVAWTHQTNAPVAMYEDERPRSGWAEILFLAERLAPKPRLVPKDARERAFMLGLCHEICGEHGLGWTRRLQLLGGIPRGDRDSLPWKYGVEDAASVAGAEARTREILGLLSAELASNGGPYLMGSELRAVDIYWACFSNLIAPLPPEKSPMPDYVRAPYSSWTGGCDAGLLALRDRVFEQHLGLPQEF